MKGRWSKYRELMGDLWACGYPSEVRTAVVRLARRDAAVRQLLTLHAGSEYGRWIVAASLRDAADAESARANVRAAARREAELTTQALRCG